MPFYNFLCENNHLFEKITSMDTKVLECPICGGKSERLFSAEGQTFGPGLPTNAYCSGASITRNKKRYDVSLFQEACEERAYAHSKAEERAQKKLPLENLWGKAKKRANRIIAGKEPPVQSQTRFKSRTV